MKPLPKILLLAACEAGFCVLQPFAKARVDLYMQRTYETFPYYINWAVSLLVFSLLAFAVIYAALSGRERQKGAALIQVGLCAAFAALFLAARMSLLWPPQQLNQPAMFFVLVHGLLAVASRKPPT